MQKLFFLILIPFFVWGTARVEMVTPFHGHMEQENSRLSEMLTEKGFPATVVTTDLSHYKGLKKDRTLWGKWMKRLSLDFPRTIEPGEDVSKIVFWNITHYFRRHLHLKKLPKEKLVLFVWEPPTLLPAMFMNKVTKYFSRIYTWEDDVIDNKTYFKFYYPVLLPMRDDIPPFEEKKFCTLVAGNPPQKYYKRSGELYSERVRAIDFFEKVGEPGFEFYGKSWDKEKHMAYRGTIADKLGTIKNYRFAICYENTGTCNGYVTEKIFDCFAAGVIPIYLGAPNIEKYVPKTCFIDRRDFATMEDLYAFLKKMTKDEYNRYLGHIRDFLSSEPARLFSQENFDQIFFEAVSR